MVNEIVQKIVKYYAPDKIVIFGSHAKDRNTSRSDIDILVLKDSALPKEVRGREVKNLFLNSFVPIDFHFYTCREFDEEKQIKYSFAHSINETGMVVYDKRRE